MRDSRLLIVTLGAILVSVCSSKSQSSDGSDYDEPVRMASESLVVKSYKDTESSTVSTTASFGDRLEEYQVYQGVMGKPGIDFPVHSYIPATSFSCRGVKKSGYYADLDTDCQVFHICDGNRKISFLCPNGTIFRQSHLICDWWFRVDCGKSVELYEESAEQLAADQKVYKARSEERERRRKYGKALGGQNGGEVTSSEVYALDEPFHINARQPAVQTQNNFASTTARTSSGRFDGRKNERHSKKVADSGITEKFPNYKDNKSTVRAPEKSRISKDRQGDARQYSTAAPVTTEPKVSFVSTQEFSATTPGYSTSSLKTRYQVQNNINFERNKENIQLAESGSLVEDLNNRERNGNFGFNNNKRTDQISDYNARDRSSNIAYNGNQRTVDQGSEFNNRGRNTGVVYGDNLKTDQRTDVNDGAFAYNSNKRTENQSADFNSRGSDANFAYNNNQKSSQTFDSNRNYNFSYTDNRNVDFSTENKGRNNEYVNNDNKRTDQAFGNNNKDRNNYFTYNTRTEEQTAVLNNGGGNGNSAYSVNAGQAADTGRQNNNFAYNENNRSENPSGQGIGAADFTTEFVNYESKRTNPVERHETVTPTAQPRKTQSSRYRSSTPPYEEQEKQFFAETASFASNRGSKSYSDFQNQYDAYNKGALTTTTTNPYKTTFYQTPRSTEGFSSTQAPPVQRFSSPIYNQNFNQQSTVDFYRTTTYRPVKQNSRKVTILPSTNPQTTVTGRIWQTTTFPPFVETTTANDKFTADDVYFTTSTPNREVEIGTENFGAGQTQRDTETQTGFNYVSSTPKPDVDITLQELNINKGFAQTEVSNKKYEDLVRDGLEVPPSSGPNALRSFALYFATTRNNGGEEGKTTSYVPVEEIEVKTTLTPFEIKKKEVVKQVDELVHGSSVNISEHDVPHTDNALPNSLTLHTQDSYSALFAGTSSENHTGTTVADKVYDTPASTEFETTAFESFTEEPYKINKELTKNDLDGSQSRGLVEPDPNSDTDYSKVSPDLRELAQVFTKALSAYLDDPEAFRRVLSEIRPTEPTLDSGISSSNPLEYPSATQEDDEVLDFSDVTKASYKKKASTATIFRETTTEYFTEAPTTNVNDIENLVLPQNFSSWATNIELTAPLFESLDQSQSSYYTPPPFVGTTNAIAEAINNEFTGNEDLPPSDSNETVDSYFPIRGSVDDPSLPRYGGFQNNTQPTTKYSPYGAELTSTTYLPYGADLTSTATPHSAASTINENKATTFNPNNVTSFFSHFSKNETQDGEIQLGKELNNLVLLQKFTTPRGSQETTTPEPNLSTTYLVTQNDVSQYQDVQLGNGETLEKNSRAGKALNFPESDINSNYFEPNAKEINLELSPPSSTPKGFLITYSLGSSSSERATYLPKATTPEVKPTTYSPGKDRITTFTFETPQPTSRVELDNVPESNSRYVTEYFTTIQPTTLSFAKSTESIDRLAHLQETLMFNTNNITTQQRDQARVTVKEMMDTLNMTDSTANTLMKVMEMAAKNETYRRLVLLLVNDKSGRNRSVEEARLSLLKALLTPVINPHQTRTVVPIPELSKLDQPEFRRRTNLRRSKSISPDVTRNVITTTPIATTTTTQRRPNGKNVRRVKTSRGLARAESSYGKTGFGNLGVIRRTIENSKNKQVKINSVDDAILDSDSRAVELLKSLYSLAARWG